MVTFLFQAYFYTSFHMHIVNFPINCVGFLVRAISDTQNKACVLRIEIEIIAEINAFNSTGEISPNPVINKISFVNTRLSRR